MSGELLAVEAAQATVLAGVEPLADVERIVPEAALGRVLAEPIVAGVSLPPWDNSAMDGYAVRAADVAGASEGRPVRLTVVGESRAGSAPDARVMPETAIRIATGAPMPAGADAVVPVEITTPLDATGNPGPRGRDAAGPLPAACLVHEPVEPGNAVRTRGSDVEAGATVVEPGVTVTPAVVALASGAGLADVVVRRRPIVAVLATGDEVRAAGTDLGPAGIPDANGPGIRALVREAGGGAPGARDRGRPARGRRGAGCGAGSPRPTSSSCRAACRSGRTTSCAWPSTPSATSTCGASRCSRASRSRSAAPTSAAAATRCSCSACRATRSRRSSRSSCSCGR